MKIEECYSTLGLSPNASDDEAKKKYRELSKQWHPDVNKSSESSEKFKKINEAYDRIKNKNFQNDHGNFSESNPFQGGMNFNIQDFFNFAGFGGSSNQSSQKVRNLPEIEIPIGISFKESVFGCKKELSFSRYIKCESCDGNGKRTTNNGCDQCHGIGRITSQKGNMVFTSPCTKCRGKVSFEKCKDCSEEGSKSTTTTISVNIPAGISNDTLRLGGIGHFVGNHPFGARHSDVYVHVRVITENDFYLQDGDVMSKLSISLLDALQGCEKQVNTLDGEKTISISPLSKNKDEIIIPKLGVARKGNQKVILNVEYPSNIEGLISQLKESN
jgi:molecular chaperone DnaJ